MSFLPIVSGAKAVKAFEKNDWHHVRKSVIVSKAKQSRREENKQEIASSPFASLRASAAPRNDE